LELATTNGKRRHGAYNKTLEKTKGTVEKRRLLRQLGITQSELSPMAIAYLDSWARLKAKLILLDRWLSEHAPGLIDEAGEGPPFLAFYVSLANSERLALKRLEEHLQRERPAEDPFARYRVVDAEETAR
jgi:hypothetical protein